MMRLAFGGMTTLAPLASMTLTMASLSTGSSPGAGYALVSQHVFCGDVFQEQFCLGAIGDIARSEDETERITQSIAQGVQFCGQSATRPADRFRLAIPPFAPALCWCARTMVASIITYSKSGSSAKTLKILSQTPFAAQRL